MSEIPEVFATFEAKVAHLLATQDRIVRTPEFDEAVRDLLTYFSGIVARAELRGADLQGADLQYANLQGANLQGANLDYSCLPLWCGSKKMIVDRRIAAQIAAHFCVLDCDDPDYLAARAAILEFAKTSHRADDLGLLEERER